MSISHSILRTRSSQESAMVGSATALQNGHTTPTSLPEIRISGDEQQSSSLPLGFEESNSTNGRNTVKLPTRYERHLKKNRLYSSLLGSSTTIVEEGDPTGSEANNEEISNDEKSREQDLIVAIQWIRQEVANMKQQDRALMRQLLDLRATIHQIRGSHLKQFRSGSTISNWISLEDNSASMTSLDKHKHGGSDVWSTLQSRAVSMLAVNHPPSNMSPPNKRKDRMNHVQSFHLLL